MQPKILLVEDNETNRNLALRFLGDDFYLLVAKDGKEGVEMAMREMPELILIDLSLPIITGWEVTEFLRKDEKTSHIPVIALTAHVMDQDRVKAFDMGCDDYETKPINFDVLINKINIWLQK